MFWICDWFDNNGRHILGRGNRFCSLNARKRDCLFGRTGCELRAEYNQNQS